MPDGPSIATPAAFTITTPSTTAKLDATRKAEVAFTATNASTQPLKGRARVVALGSARPEWFTIDGDAERPFAAGGTQQYTVRVNVPASAAPGKYTFQLKIAAVENPDELYGEGPQIAFEVPKPVQKATPIPWLWIIIAIVVLLVLLGGGFLAFKLLSGGKPVASPDKTTLTFADQGVGTLSAPQTVTVTNTSSTDLHVTAVSVTGTNASAFKVTGDHCSSTTVAAKKTCTVDVAFNPPAAGTASATLSISDDASDSPQKVALLGNGASPSIGPSATPIGAGSFTIVASTTVGANNFGTAVATCPSGNVAISGGIDLNNVFSMKVTASGPMFAGNRLLLTGDGTQGSPTGWWGAARNEGAAAQSLKVAVICSAPISGLTTQVGSSTVGAGSFASVRLSCPAGDTALGGGVDLNNVLTMWVTSSAPTFAQNNTRLFFQPDGTNPGAIGWQATAKNSTSGALPMKAAVICAPNVTTTTVVASSSVTAGGFNSTRVGCPSGQAALGGGTDLQNVLTMTVTSSGETYVQNNSRLIFQPDGREPGAVGWQASALNNDPNQQPFKTAVICAN